MIITSGTDHILHLWCPKTGASKGLLIGHKDDAYVLFSHPVYREYIISAGHDGFLIVSLPFISCLRVLNAADHFLSLNAISLIGLAIKCNIITFFPFHF